MAGSHACAPDAPLSGPGQARRHGAYHEEACFLLRFETGSGKTIITSRAPGYAVPDIVLKFGHQVRWVFRRPLMRTVCVTVVIYAIHSALPAALGRSCFLSTNALASISPWRSSHELLT